MTSRLLLLPFAATVALTACSGYSDEILLDEAAFEEAAEQATPDPQALSIHSERSEPTEQPEELPAVSGLEAPATEPKLLGSDACKDVRIRITNSRERDGVVAPIQIEYVRYFSVDEGRWYKEQLVNAILLEEQTLVWTEDLQHAEGDEISNWQPHYRVLDSDGWGSIVHQTVSAPDPNCQAGDSFTLIVQ